MEHQLDLAAHGSVGPTSRATDPETSRQAPGPRTVGRQVADVVTVIARRRGAICAQVAADLGRDRGCVSRRITDARRRGLVRADGTRTAPSGKFQNFWVATASGQALAARRIAEGR